MTGRRLAFDIGGANLKAAHEDGPTRTVAFELWKHPDGLAAALLDLTGALPPADTILITMTGELCDCFRTRADGVRSILESVATAAGDRPVRVWGIDGRFHDVATIRDRPHLAAASNWLATATVVARDGFGASGLLIDVGSTTTDLIPWRDGAVATPPDARTDFARLRSGSLVYRGVRRTPLMILGVGGFGLYLTRVMAELFATTADVFVTLGDIPADPDDRSTADGRPLTVAAGRDRLARMFGLDRDDFSPDDARDYARFCEQNILSLLEGAATTVAIQASIDPPATVVVAGSGEFLARRVAERAFPGVPVRSLAEAWGADASVAACARALLLLARGEDA